MSIFRNTADLKQFADIHKETSWDTLKPYVEQAENDYIIPLLSQEEFATFNSPINVASAVSKDYEQIFPDEIRRELFRIMARAVANFALYEAFPFLNTSVGDAGIQQMNPNSGTSTAAAQWRYESRRSAHLTIGDTYADKMLEFLEKNYLKFPEWKSSKSYTITKDLFIGSSTLLSEYIGTNDSRRAYIAIRPYIRLVEKQYILPILGKDLFDQLKAQSLSGVLTESNELLIGHVKEAIAWTAYYSALPFISLRINGDGIQVMSKNDTINNRSAATKDEKDEARAQAGRFSDSFMNTLKQYLELNQDSYPFYKAYWNKSYPKNTYLKKRNKSGSGHFIV